jgi:uncharacterized protein (DUF1800 family)
MSVSKLVKSKRWVPHLLLSISVVIAILAAVLASVLVALLLPASKVFAASNSGAIGADAARHLLSRTGFSTAEAEIAKLATLTRQEAVAKVVVPADERALLPLPAWLEEKPLTQKSLAEKTREAQENYRKVNNERTMELRDWWVGNMLQTETPLAEKMTLFWHNHFATSQQKVRIAHLVYAQNMLFRKQALGNFGTLLRELSRDPAMLIYLDSVNSKKEAPNENFAREVMELFSLGEGNYTEKDIKEAARAFTGWSVDRESGKYMFRRGAHDFGKKTIFGKTGNFDGDQVIDLILARPEAAQFITRKLWREFVSPTPDESEVKRLALVLQNSGYDLAKLMAAMLSSDAFFAADNRGVLIKSPVEFVVGTVKTFNVKPPNVRPFVLQIALLGQNLFLPPNVKGWPGGEVWINSASLLNRKQMLDRLFGSEDRMETVMANMDALAEMNGEKLPTKDARMARRMERTMGGVQMNLPAVAKSFVRPDGDAAMRRVVLPIAPVNPPRIVNTANAKSDSMAMSAAVNLPTAPSATGLGDEQALLTLRHLVNDPTYQLK